MTAQPGAVRPALFDHRVVAARVRPFVPDHGAVAPRLRGPVAGRSAPSIPDRHAVR